MSAPLDPCAEDVEGRAGDSFGQLWAELVPDVGEADTVPGEVLRSVGRVASENRRNGMLNWSDDLRDMCRFARRHLTDGTFSPQWTEWIDDVLRRTLILGDWYVARDALEEDDPRLEQMEDEGPDEDVAFEEHDMLENLAELWVRRHIELAGEP